MHVGDQICVADPDGFVWLSNWKKSAIFGSKLERQDGGGTAEVPILAEVFAAKGWKIVPFDENAPRNRTDAEKRGVPLVRLNLKQEPPNKAAKRAARKED